jgi:hypothetical protein
MISVRLRHTALVAVGCLALTVSGCDKVRDQLGLNKNPPDEFRVVSRAPLNLPPEYQLRPPQPGSDRPQEGTPRQQASQTVFGRDDELDRPSYQDAPGLSQGEKALLGRAGADDVPDDIRNLVDAETRQMNEEAQSFVDTLVFWRDPQRPEELVNAEDEARRLQENAALGEDVTQGDTPTIERKERGLLEGIF